jgi:putative tributyrin esterase
MSTAATSHFRTTETGDLPCPHGTLKLVTVKSPALKARADVTLYIPKQAKGHTDLPVVLLLHGVYGSHWAWALSGNAHTTLQNLIDTGELPPMILAMPSDGLWGDGSGYVPHHGQDFEKWITDDVPQLVSEVTGNQLDAPHFIAGLSMGGFGALRLGAQFPDRFRAFSGLSSITALDQMSQFIEDPIDAYRTSSDQPQQQPQSDSVIETILQNRQSLRPFRFDCGTDDPLLEANRILANNLERENIPFTYEEFPGGHEWPYWQTHLAKTLQFFGNQL